MPAMPTAGFAASGRARTLLSRLDLAEQLGVGAEEIGGGVAAIAASKSLRGNPRPRRAVPGPVLGHAHRDPPKRRWAPAHFLSEDSGQRRPAAEVNALVSESALGAIRRGGEGGIDA
jgi:hypothetical protein